MTEFGLKSLSSTQVSRATRLLGVRSCGGPHPTAMTNSKPGGAERPARFDLLDAATRNRGRAVSGVTLPCCRQSKARRPSLRSLEGTGPAGPGGEGRPGRPPPRSRRVGGTRSGRTPRSRHRGRAFLEDLVRRGMRGVEAITSDDHAGLPSRHLGRRQARAGRRHSATPPVPPGATRHPTCRHDSDPQTQRRPIARDLQRQQPRRHRLARGRHPRRSRCLHPARASPQPHADRQPESNARFSRS